MILPVPVLLVITNIEANIMKIYHLNVNMKRGVKVTFLRHI